MACTLSASPTGTEDFIGAVGAAFIIAMTGPSGSGLTVIAVSYGGTTITAPPFTFNIAAGTNFLFIHFDALAPGAKLQVIEVCGASAQVLETLFFDPNNPGTGLELTGH